MINKQFINLNQRDSLYNVFVKIFTKKNVIITLIGVVSLFCLYFVYSYGFVTVEYSGYSGANLQIIDKNNQTKTIESYSSGKRLFIKKGYYNFNLSSNSASGFIAEDTVGFLRTTKLNTELQPGLDITVAANVNNGCIDVNKGVVYEFSCHGSDYISKFVSATANQPSYAEKSEEDAILYGSITIKDGSQVQLKRYLLNDYNPVHKYTLLINSSDKVGVDHELGEDVGIASYLDGFIVYSKDTSKACIYSSSYEATSCLDFDLAKDKQGAEIGTVVKGKYITQYVISDNEYTDKTNDNNVSYYDGKEVKLFNFSQNFSKVLICEDKRLCTLNSENGFSVYDITSLEKPIRLSRVFDGQNMVSGEDGVYVATSGNLLKTKLGDDVEYEVIDSYINNNSCGLYYFDTIYGCRVVDELGKNLLIQYNQNSNKKEDIINKIVQLSKHKDISAITINNKYVFINAEYPNTVDKFGRTVVDRSNKTSIFQSINNAIDEQKIDRNEYSIKIL